MAEDDKIVISSESEESDEEWPDVDDLIFSSPLQAESDIRFPVSVSQFIISSPC